MENTFKIQFSWMLKSIWLILKKIPLAMRLLIIILCFSLGLAHAASSYAQTAVLNLNVNNESVESVLKRIEDQTEFTFFYNTKQIDTNRKISLSANKKDIFKILDEMFKGTNISYSVLDKSIILSDNKEAPSTNQPHVTNQDITVSGLVKDENGEAIIGAAIVVVGSSKNTMSDIDGHFSISVPEGAILKISYLGFFAKEITVTGNMKMPLDIALKEDLQLLDEVVVVGYGVQKRSDVTGAIASVTAEKLNATPSTNLGEMLRGAAPGIQVNLSNAAPGGSSQIIIRGRKSLNRYDAPLYIVDGVPMASIDDFNSNDIASLEILKDASAQAVYGSRASSGVILITTKRGLTGKPKISYSNYFASQSIHKNFEFYNGEEWAALRKEAFYNANKYYDESDCFSDIMLDVLKSGEWVDWEDLMIKSAWQQKHDILIQSGNEKTKYALGLGYFDQDGMVPKSGFQRLTGRLNIDHQLFKNITIGTNFSYTKSWTKTADGSFNSFITMPPLAKVYNDDGSLREDVTEAGESHYNPLWNIDYSDNKSQTDRLLINFFVDWKITKDLSYRANGSMNTRNVQTNTYQGLEHTTGRNNNGKATVGSSFYNDYLFENIINYAKEFNADHRFDATLMQSVNVNQWKSLGINGTGFANDDLTYNAIGSALSYGSPDWQLSDRKLLSYLARARYNLLNRYMLTASLRIDGSSVFGKNNKYGYFPSAALAWRVNEESFMKDAKWVSNMKLRLSYGEVGNQAVSPYKSLALTEKYLTEFGNSTAIGYLPGAELLNPNLKWETSTSMNAGIDFGFFNGRISGSIEYYATKNTNLLLDRKISNTLGYTYQTVNLGRMDNRGIEVALNVTPVSVKDFDWSMNFTFSKNKNEIKKIDNKVDANGKPVDNVNSNWFIGYPTNVYYDYVFDGIWQTDDDIANSHMPTATPGSIKLRDVNGDGEITTADRVVMQRDPEWFGSVGTSVKYRDFDLSADLFISHGGTIYNTYLTSFENGGDLTAKRNGIRRNYWTLNNPSNEAPAPNMNQAPANVSVLGYQDASYIRLRDVTLGYNVPHKLISKVYMDSLRFYTKLSNFWTKTDVQAYGPEQTPGDYPEPRTILFGMNVTF